MNRFLFWLGAALLGGGFLWYLVARALALPITIDEASTCMNSVPRPVFDILTYRADPVPNNHILNTLGIKLFAAIGGLNHFTARLPALLGGLLYLVAACGLAQRLARHWFVRLLAVVLLLGNPFVDEFFALGRGYGVALGLMLAAIWQAWVFLETPRRRTLAVAVALAGLSVLANFAWLNFFAPFVTLLTLWLVVNQKSTSLRTFLPVVAGGVVACAVLCYLPLLAISSTDQLVFWGKNGFWRETLLPLVKSSLPPASSENDVLQHALVWVGLALAGWLLWALVLLTKSLGKPRNLQIWLHPRTFVVALTAGVVLANHLQAWLLDVPFLNARASLFFYTLLALQTAVLLGWLLTPDNRENLPSQQVQRYKLWPLFFLPLAVLVVWNFNRHANLRYSREWYFDDKTFDVLNALRDLHHREGATAPYTLDVNGWMVNSFVFHTKHANWPDYSASVRMPGWHPDQKPQGNTEFYLATSAEEAEALRQLGYQIGIDLDPHGNLKLWRKAGNTN